MESAGDFPNPATSLAFPVSWFRYLEKYLCWKWNCCKISNDEITLKFFTYWWEKKIFRILWLIFNVGLRTIEIFWMFILLCSSFWIILSKWATSQDMSEKLQDGSLCTSALQLYKHKCRKFLHKNEFIWKEVVPGLVLF